MLNLDSKLYQIPLPIVQDYRILTVDRTDKRIKSTIMIPISEDEEFIIDNIGKITLQFHRGNKNFSVQMKDIYCYGEIDFTDEETCNKIETFNFLNYLDTTGIPIYSNYNYESHSCSSPIRRILWTETWSPLILVKMAHGYLGKPQRILLFNQTTK